jgi:hypothetical protein
MRQKRGHVHHPEVLQLALEGLKLLSCFDSRIVQRVRTVPGV